MVGTVLIVAVVRYESSVLVSGLRWETARQVVVPAAKILRKISALGVLNSHKRKEGRVK